MRAIKNIQLSAMNRRIYGDIKKTDPHVQDIAKDIRKSGFRRSCPIVLTLDDFLISGHCRRLAAIMAGRKMVPTMCEPVYSWEEDKYLKLLVQYNAQRVKTLDAHFRERFIQAADDVQKSDVVIHDLKRAWENIEPADILTIRERNRKRSKISPVKLPLLTACIRIINEKQRQLSERDIHYGLLGARVPRNAENPTAYYGEHDGSRKKSGELKTLAEVRRTHSQDLSNLLVRAQLEGHIPWGIIIDETRPVVQWDVHKHVDSFVKRSLRDFLNPALYNRDLMQSQPFFPYIISEKLANEPWVRPIAEEYTIGYTLGRGYSNIGVRRQLFEQFEESGKAILLLFIIGDFDADGWDCVNSYPTSLSDDFGIASYAIRAKHVMLTHTQATHQREELGLVNDADQNLTSPRWKAFAKEFGDDVTCFEIEALPDDMKEKLLTDAIESSLDQEAYQHELSQEAEDKAFIAKKRKEVMQNMS
jgi:hypothetical protein